MFTNGPRYDYNRFIQYELQIHHCNNKASSNSLQVLDNDVFAAFEETGDVFDAETAERCRKLIYSAGNTVAPQDLFRTFRGRDPDISYLLKNRGLI